VSSLIKLALEFWCFHFSKLSPLHPYGSNQYFSILFSLVVIYSNNQVVRIYKFILVVLSRYESWELSNVR